ncbi:hypothetical protein [Desulfogranum marinum]|uniref:hypothetical protein n=1 Tax=Desulfogranum marinum TaxID=453220 RepID=UPI001962F7AF|nr:hypothetical protein [Desulfogranum marinum]MBM9515268.1 hypothetical protein [Desulfogranum marinum]
MIKEFRSFSTLDVSEMFFQSALTNCFIAIKNNENSNKKISELVSNSWLDKYEVWNCEGEIDTECSNNNVTYVEGEKNKNKEPSRIFLQATAATHIFCIAVLERYINKTAQTLLIKSKIEYFEKFSLEEKWLLLPLFLSKKGFVPDQKPFQNFSELIKIKNALVHDKGQKIPYDIKNGEVDVYKSLGLTIEDAVRSVKTTKEMIEKIAKLIEQEPPAWIKDPSHDTIELR